ncbi:MAG: lysylphosphatidylglycerol synthase transmembrane domain-containing protein [Candidatus Aminicenantes bacterium]|nr:lysylphosphatidylglycerol synthase transmembrane domain-containing protein [Candidatus Aminicenantes bacterium]
MNRKNWIRLVLVLGLTAVLLFVFIQKTDWGEAFKYLKTHVKWGMLLLVVLLTPLHMLTRAWRWKVLMVHEKPDVRMYNMISANAVGFTVSYIFPGRIGELVKPLYLARQEKCRPGFAIGTVVVERIFDVFTMCALLGIFLLARPLYVSIFNLQADSMKRLTGLGIIGASAATVLLAVCLGFIFFRDKALALTGAVLRIRIFSERFRAKVLELLHEFIDGLKFFRSPRTLLAYIALSFVVWLGIIFYYWVFFLAFDIHLNYFFLFPYIFLTAVGASIPTPGMIGGYHTFSQQALIELFGMNPNEAGGLTVVFHAVQYVVTCLVGFLFLWKDGLSLVQIKRLGEAKNP